ncbi:hypothetical protein A3F37_01945 [Candidatus Saccharibacteria bacterium RIFCSPHIGHO2_12_FULL_41_12]|nr:MAG: hypothetical protein A3F37_01945 [Candidatus Saccharibacteria bacterium RIFCSPHIGHO2_12_FULL_41_12]
MNKEGAPIARCPNSVLRGAQLITREFASSLVAVGQDPRDSMPFLKKGIETVEDAFKIKISPSCVGQVLRCVLPVQSLEYPGQEELLRK